jgi:hypothetical protein
MRRLETYKRKRRGKRLVLYIVAVSILAATVGLTVVDKAVSSMLGVDDGFKIIGFTKKAEAIYNWDFMNCKGELDLSYINRDLDYLNKKVKGIYNSAQMYILKIK